MEDDEQEPKQPNCCAMFGFKLRTLCKALANPLITRFFIFLVIQGLVMPTFTEFDYFFAIDVLGIKASLLSLQSVWSAFFLLIVPALYVFKLKDCEYRNLFLTV
jgi:hypothetical protein